MGKIGIIGGTFNPIHFGHLILAQSALEEVSLDKVLFIPSGSSYMKQDVLDAARRYEMTALAIEGCDRFEISDIEVRRQGNSYTCETLEELQQRYPTDQFYFICGADTLFSLESWYRPADILRQCTLLCMFRTGWDVTSLEAQKVHLQKEFHAEIVLLEMRAFDISSSEIRSRVYDKKTINFFVPEKVKDYILAHHLYQQQSVDDGMDC